jgi:hypothetical protein
MQFPYKEVFPKMLVNIIDSVCTTLGFKPDYFCPSLLLAIAGSIGKTYKLKVKTSWYESAALFLCLCGRPGANKSHPLSWSLKPLFDETERAILASLADKPPEDEMMAIDIRPMANQLVLNNCTAEAVVKEMSNGNVRQILWSDELLGFLKNLNRYNSGSDVEMVLSIFSGQNIITNRKSDKPVFIKSAFACIAGTVQPAVLKDVFKAGNGLADRFLFVMPEDDTKMGQNRNELDQSVIDQYTGFINQLLSLEMDTANGQMEPNILSMTDDAFTLAMEWFNANTDRINLEENDLFRGFYTKLDSYIYRFALILHIIDCVCEGRAIGQVDTKDIESAIALAEYFRSMNERVFGLLTDDPVDSLTPLQQKVYKALQPVFPLMDGIGTANTAGMSKRNFKYFVKRKDLFKRIERGRYEKTCD